MLAAFFFEAVSEAVFFDLLSGKSQFGGHFGPVRGAFGAPLGSFLAPFSPRVPPVAPHGQNHGSFGWLLGSIWGPLGHLWEALGYRGSPFLLLFSAVFSTPVFGYLFAGVLLRLGTFWASFWHPFGKVFRPKRALSDSCAILRFPKEKQGKPGIPGGRDR